MTQVGLAVSAALNHGLLPSHTGVPRFVSAQALQDGEAYEAFIRRTGQVPTRDNLHDLFNGLVWQQFPQTKARLNQLQSDEIARMGVGAKRGPVRDAITVFDENGALLLASPVLWDALLARDWHRLFVTERSLWAHAQLVLFGHALMEQLVSPRKSITAHVFVEQFATNLVNSADALDADTMQALDADLVTHLNAERLATKPFTPLPVQGVPGWCVSNQQPEFYADAGVFRPAKRQPG